MSKPHLKHVEVIILPDGRMNASNAAAYIGIAEKTLATMRCEGTGPPFIKMGRIFYYQRDLDNWLAQAERVTSTAQVKAIKGRYGDISGNLA